MTWTSSSTLNSQYFMYHGRCQVHVIVRNKAVPVTGLAQNSSQALHQAQWHVVRKVDNILVVFMILHDGHMDFAQWACGFTQWVCGFCTMGRWLYTTACGFCTMGMWLYTTGKCILRDGHVNFAPRARGFWTMIRLGRPKKTCSVCQCSRLTRGRKGQIKNHLVLPRKEYKRRCNNWSSNKVNSTWWRWKSCN